VGAECAENKLGTGKGVGIDEHAVHTSNDNANLRANSRKQDLAIDAGPGLRRSREMATIGKLENIPSVLFNLWRK
jgi:hypothetical protein